MADPATDTTYPTILDLLPHVPPNARENDPGLEHDIVHTRANAVLNALMRLVGTVDAADPLSILGRLLLIEEGGVVNTIIPGDGISVDNTDPENPVVSATSTSNDLTIITESSAFTADPVVHAGLHRYIRAGGDVTFDSAETYTEGQVFNIRSIGALELVGAGVTLSPTYGGTLDLEFGMGVQVVMTGPTTADVNGLTVAA
ncbi:hypothetical protein WCE39_07925 [Luteimonas sp. MJ174]|uniref:hypothetical protein n=1 Tax=Luteimonas sp. MJ174 TaxID=3129237 RepID=UPI0031BB9F3D